MELPALNNYAIGIFASQRLKDIGDSFQGEFPVGFVDCRAQMRVKGLIVIFQQCR